MKRAAIALLLLLAAVATAQRQAEVVELMKSDDWEKALTRLVTEKARLTSDVIKTLKHEDPKVRARAAIALRVMDSANEDLRSSEETGLGPTLRPAAVEALAKAAADTDAKVRKESVWTLAYLLRNRRFGHHGEPWSDPKELVPLIALGKKATAPLVEFLRYEDPNDKVVYAARITAVRVLTATKDPAAIDGLIALVNASDHFLLSEAMTALAQYDDPRIVRVLIDNVDKKIHSYEDTPGVWALRKMRERAVPDLLWAIANHPKAEVRGYCAHVFEHVPDPRAVPVLQKATTDPDENVRIWAVGALAFNPHPGNIPIIVGLLSDKSAEMRGRAAYSLGSLREASAFAAVAALLNDPEMRVRQYAAASLPAIGGAKATPLLIPLLKEPEMQRTVVAALAVVKPKEAESGLIELLAKGDDYARYDAALLLGNMKSTAAIPALLVLLQDDWFLRSAAAKALGEIGSPALDSLLKLLANAKEGTRHDILAAIGETRDPRAFDAVVPYLKDDKIGFSAIIALGKLGDQRAIELIKPFLTAGNGTVRRSAVEAMGDLKAVEVLPQLIKALDDKDDYVDSAAMVALGKIGDKRALEPLLKIAQTPEEGRWMAIEALGFMPDPRSIPVLIKLLDDDWPDNAAAARALGKIGDPSALPALTKASKSGDEKLAADAKAAIEAIKKKK